MTDLLPGDYTYIRSIDEPGLISGEESYPVEVVNAMNPNGFPPHVLRLKPRQVIMLLRNLDTSRGLANGTRLIIDRVFRRCVMATIITRGTFFGRQVYIPPVILENRSPKGTIVFTRRQLPVRTAYAMTINKSQGQTLERVGVYLPRPVFAHGQLYVALSRAKDPANISVLSRPFRTAVPSDLAHRATVNVVDRSLLL